MRYRNILIVGFILLLSYPLFAKNKQESWHKFALKYKPFKNFSLELTPQIRFAYDDSVETKAHYLDFDFGYDIFDFMSISFMTRSGRKWPNLDDEREWNFRSHLKFEREVIKDFDLSYRFAWQKDWLQGYSKKGNLKKETARLTRHEFKGSYKLTKRIDTELEAEFFHIYREKGVKFNKLGAIRYTLAFEFETFDDHKLEIGMSFQDSKNYENKPEGEDDKFIYRLSYGINF